MGNFVVKTKACSKCKKVKGRDDFNRDARMKSGLESWCRECHSAYCAEYNRTKLDRRTDEYRAKQRLYNRTYRKKHNGKSRKTTPDGLRKDKCRAELWKAIGRREVRRIEICENCASREDIQAHHIDYDRPLFVFWLCRDCHGAKHRGVTDGN